MMFWILIISLGIAWALQSALSMRQMKAFSDLFVGMRRKGKVCMGRFSGGIAQGAIVLFLLDDDGRVRSGQRLHGVSVLARFRPFELYDGLHMGDVDPSAARGVGKSLVKAVDNACKNYHIVTTGGHAPEPPSALGRTLDKLPTPWRRKSAGHPPETRAVMPETSAASSTGRRIVRRHSAVSAAHTERS